jgi:SAM-dependent methyltransferase
VELGSYYTSGIRFKMLIDYLTDLDPGDMLLIGCERGYVESQLPETISITSIDINDEYVRDAERRNAGLANREFITMNLFDVPGRLANRRYDVAVMSEVIEHVEDDHRAAKIAFDVLRPGGELILTVPNTGRFPNRVRKALGSAPRAMAPGHLREYTSESAVALANSAGFSCERIVGVDFWLPFDRALRHVIPVGFAGRRIAGERWIGAATWFQLHCRKPAR